MANERARREFENEKEDERMRSERLHGLQVEQMKLQTDRSVQQACQQLPISVELEQMSM